MYCTFQVCRMSCQIKNVTNNIGKHDGKTQSSLNEGQGTWEVRYREANNSRTGRVVPKILFCRKTRKGFVRPINDFCLSCLRSKLYGPQMLIRWMRLIVDHPWINLRNYRWSAYRTLETFAWVYLHRIPHIHVNKPVINTGFWKITSIHKDSTV
jgi:hypothetical protein